MAIEVREFACSADTTNGVPTSSSYTFSGIPNAHEHLGTTFRNGQWYIGIRGDYNLTLLNPGGSKTFRPVAPGNSPVTGSIFAGYAAYDMTVNPYYWFEDP